MRDVIDPQTGVSVGQRRRARAEVNGSDMVRAELISRADMRISPLGSGSDYSPFLQHLGVASLNIGFGGEAPGGSYHTLYDTYEHYTKFIDPGLTYGVALAKVAGRSTIRLANAPRLPFDFVGLADNISLYLDEIETLAETLRTQTEADNRRNDSGIYELALDPTKSYVAPAKKTPLPYFQFRPAEKCYGRTGTGCR